MVQPAQITKTFDPLEEDGSLTQEFIGAKIKREISNIIKSYSGWYDPFSELIQNALDAVDERAKENDPSYIPSIWIKIDLKNNRASVTDNGVGFSEKQFRNFLKPSISWKRGTFSRGSKGVGATFVAYGFNLLNIGTKTKSYSYCGTMKHGREWVEDETNTVLRPEVEECSPMHEAFGLIDNGSTFTLGFEGKYVFPQNLSWIGATTAKQWDAVLRINTPLGGIYMDRTPTKTTCHITVIDESGKEDQLSTNDCKYVYPHEVIPTCRNFKELIVLQDKASERGKYAGRTPAEFTNLNGLYAFWKYDEILDKKGVLRPNLSDDQKELLTKHKVHVYGFLCYSTSLWDYYNDITLGIRKNARILKGGLQLAANGMPQGKLLVIPLTSSIGLQQQAHIIVHFDSAEPDLGRKGFKQEIQELAEDLSTSLIAALKDWRHSMRKETGPASILEDSKLDEWIELQKQHEKESPITIKHPEFFKPINELPILSAPLSEQDVVALFHQLLAGGVIRGLKIMATSQHEQYDGIYRVWLRKPLENHVFDKESNPLGIDKSRTLTEFESKPYVLEYKYNLDYLIHEFENEEKNEKNINLAIVWEMGSEWKRIYQVNTLLSFSNIHNRIFHGATHQIVRSDTGQALFYVIVLKELIDYINDPEGVQEYHQRTYSGN